MGVIGHWRRSVLGAGGVALLLPLGLALGVALTTAFGGAETLRALGQVFAGPSAPEARGGGPSVPGLESANDVPSVPVRARNASGAAPGSQTAGTPSRAPSADDAPLSGPSGPAPAPTPTPDPGPASPTPPATDPAPPASPAPSGVSGGSAANQAGQAVADAVESLPAPVGAVGGNAVQTVVDLIP